MAVLIHILLVHQSQLPSVRLLPQSSRALHPSVLLRRVIVHEEQAFITHERRLVRRIEQLEH